MTPPVPRNEAPSLLAPMLIVAVVLGAATLLVFSRMPGPQPPGTVRQMLVLHESMAAQGRPSDDGISGPSLHLASQLEGESVDSWLYGLAGRAATVHRLDRPPPLPRNAQQLPAEGGAVDAMDHDDLTSLCWRGPEHSLCVVGPQPVADLKRLVARVRASGPGPTL